MIIDFTVENYRSFKEESTLSLSAETALKDKGVALTKTGLGDTLLPVVGIFGPNAGGKSNLINALDYVQDAILNTDHINHPVNEHPLLQPFLLNASSRGEPTCFRLGLWDKENSTQYQYEFEVGENGVEAERLKVLDRPKKNSRTRRIFEREGSHFVFDAREEEKLIPLKELVQKTALAVSVFANFNHSMFKQLIELVKPQKLKIFRDSGGNRLGKYGLKRFYNDESLRGKVINFIRNSDVSIKNIYVDRLKLELNDVVPPDAPEELRAMVAKDLKEGSGHKYVPVSAHSVYDESGNALDSDCTFDFYGQESLGTQKLFSLAVILFETLDKGEAFVFDEFGSSLHPFLTRRLMELFQDPELNRNGAQLIFASHEVFLMDTTTPLYKKFNLRRDQIWFVDKDRKEVSELRSLSEYKTRKDYDLVKRYVEGRFGAVPALILDGDRI